MVWTICFSVSFLLLAVSLICSLTISKLKNSTSSIITSSNLMFVGVLASSTAMFYPIYHILYSFNNYVFIKTFLLSLHSAIRLFVIDGELGFVVDNLYGCPNGLKTVVFFYAAFMYIFAPTITLGVVLSFFKNFSAYKRYFLNYSKPAYIFSELNEKSLALLESLNETPEKKIFIFTDVFDKEEEENYELLERAKSFGAICFKKDIVSVDFSKHSSNAPLFFYTIGKDETENIDQSIKIISKYKSRKNTNLYVFSTRFEAEMLLANEEKGNVKVRRINEVQSLIYRNLYENGNKIFEYAAKNDGKISAAVIGMGKHGTEMVKALSWFCQMDNYSIEINAFDYDELKKEQFVRMCPELMSENYNCQLTDPGDSQYKINIHCEKDPNSGTKMDVNSAYFYSELKKIKNITYLFVSLGNDEDNIKTAVELKSFLESNGNNNVFIQSIVCDSEKNHALKGIRNYSGQSYGIDFIGDTKTSYSSSVIMKSDLEAKALARHLKWGKEEEFWMYEYNYRSSIASAIHSEMKKKCNIPGINLPPLKREMSDRIALQKLEHRRWNTYMRSEGYSWSGSIEKSSRNNLAKLHCFLVPFEQLPQKEKEKDDD